MCIYKIFLFVRKQLVVAITEVVKSTGVTETESFWGGSTRACETPECVAHTNVIVGEYSTIMCDAGTEEGSVEEITFGTGGDLREF